MESIKRFNAVEGIFADYTDIWQNVKNSPNFKTSKWLKYKLKLINETRETTWNTLVFHNVTAQLLALAVALACLGFN